MVENRGYSTIKDLHKKWNNLNSIATIMLAFAISCLASAAVIKLVYESFFIVPIIFIIVFLVMFSRFTHKFNESEIVQFVNRTFPEFEESSSLLLKTPEDLNLLEKLQVQKIGSKIGVEYATPLVIRNRLRTAFMLLIVAILAILILAFVPTTFLQPVSKISKAPDPTAIRKPETKPGQVNTALIKISPPSYTGKGIREQDRFNIVAEQDAIVSWRITTTNKVKKVALLFNDKSVLQLKPADDNHTSWLATRQIKNTGFYQVTIENSLSELYQVEMIKDQPPSIVVQAPKPNTLLEYGQPQKVSLRAFITDDYGIKDAFIQATIASGSGEAVKFKEQKFLFTNFLKGTTHYQSQQSLNLATLEMQPGDELYFYIDATDNHQQNKRSDIFIVRLEDTVQLMSIDGLVSGIDNKPEFFRSQRQIIIETEQLLKDRTSLDVEALKKKSNDLGIDQKLLRLRYGKFLGEESETEIGTHNDHDDDAGHQGNTNQSGADKILDQYSHKHDIAEDATLFDAKTKKQLLATLSQMWEAELQLRTFNPKEALPFEYKALRLLKDLQQQTRSYVGKTGSKTTPLKPEIRLTGDLTKVTQPVIIQNFQQTTDAETIFRKALGVMELVRSKEVLTRSSIEMLEKASTQLSLKAAAEPSVYLASFEAVRRILRNQFKPKDVELAARAFQKIISVVSSIPQQSKVAPTRKLSERYFMNLKRKND